MSNNKGLRVLLVGEYSGVHTNLSLALREKGIDVVTMSEGDGYKSFPRDVDLAINGGIYNKFKKLNLIFDYLGVKGIYSLIKSFKKIWSLEDFDVVQIINPVAISCYSSLANYILIRILLYRNKRLYLCALGDDYYWVKYCLEGHLKYSPFDRLDKYNFKKYLFSFKYIYGLGFKSLNKFVVRKSEKIIPGLLDYKIPYSWSLKTTDVVQMPLTTAQIDNAKKLILEYSNEDIETISVFHGWQKGKEEKKGNDLLDAVMNKILLKYGSRISYKVVTDLPYSEYVKQFDNSDIFLDQVYSYDMGVNALLGMASGKVVVSGFEARGIDDLLIGINAVPDENELFEKLDAFFSDTTKISEVRLNSLKYIISNHNPDYVANKYLELWGSRG